MHGEVVGPFHHYCRPIRTDIIQCILFEGMDENVRMTEIKFIISKRLVRSTIPELLHKQKWHDHKEEIETERIAILNLTDPKAQSDLADYVSNTDGIIFHLWTDDEPIQDGSVMIAHSVAPLLTSITDNI